MTDKPNLARLLDRVPRYDTDWYSQIMRTTADGSYLRYDYVLAALEAAMPADVAEVVEEAGKVLEGVPDGLEVVCGDVCADGVAMPLALVPDEYAHFARFIAKAPGFIRALISIATAQAAQIDGLAKERDEALESVTNNNDWFSCCMDVWGWLMSHPNMPDIEVKEGGSQEVVENYKSAITSLISAALAAERAKTAKLVEAGENAANELRTIAGMDLMGASATAWNAARELEAALSEEARDGGEQPQMNTTT